jgi:site-specific DNA-adenine methylase
MKELLKTNYQCIKKLLKEKNNDEDFNRLFTLLSFLNYSGVDVVFQYPGSKQKMKKELIYCLNSLVVEKVKKTNKGFKIFIDGFVGAMNSTIVLMDELVLLGFEKVIVNDINPCLVQVHFDIRNRPNELIADYLEIIRTKYILKYDGFFLEKEQYEEINSELNEEFMELQRKKEFGIRTSIIFLLLQGIMFSGIPKYDNDKESDDTDFKFSNKIYDMKRYHSVLLNQIPKIRKFSKIYNKIDIEFRNQDFFNLVEEFKNNEEVLFNLDVPYIKEGKEKISDEILSKMTSKDLEDCVINYNQFFDHIKMIKELNNINFIYNNNAHPVLNYYANEFNIKVGNFIRNEVVSSKLNKKTEKVKELILFKNSLLNKSVATNQSSYRPIELVA